MYCSKCGAALSSDAGFCTTCGNPIARGYVAPAPPAAAVSPHAGVGAIAYVEHPLYAGFWLRLVAHLLDGVIIGAASMLLVIPFFFLMGGMAMVEGLPRHGGERPDPALVGSFVALILLLAGVGILAQWLYYGYMESGERQATWGKQALGLYVTDLAGQRVSFGRASGRFFAKMITGLIPLGIGYIMAGLTERRQALHDMIASTLVLRR